MLVGVWFDFYFVFYNFYVVFDVDVFVVLSYGFCFEVWVVVFGWLCGEWGLLGEVVFLVLIVVDC